MFSIPPIRLIAAMQKSIGRTLALAGPLAALLVTSCGSDSPTMELDCPTGTEGCGCFANGTCDPGLECQDDGFCGPESEPECPPGTEGCECYPNDTCDSGLYCNNFGVCEDESNAQQPPTDPKCYTPCRQGLTLPNDEYVPCPSDGLMEGCYGNTICVEGSCVSAESSQAYMSGPKGPGDPGYCATDLECPDFQTCIASQCYSNCDIDEECEEGFQCHRHVCRQPCSIDSADECPAGTVCENVDGTNGYCMIKSPQNANEQEKEVLGTFFLDTSFMEFTSLALEFEVVLTNNSPQPMKFTVSKDEHTEFDDTGETVITEDALSWIEIGVEGDTTVESTYDVTVPANSEETLVFVDTENTSLDRWEGLITVGNDELGQRRVYVRRESNPKGHWAGTMYYFANFGERGLDDWRADKDDPVAVQHVGNAFVKRWIALQQGDLTVDEFRAVISATKEESWKWGSVKDRCPNESNPNSNVGCYLYDVPGVDTDSGISVYSSDLRYFPIPTAVSELPIAMNLRPDPDGAVTEWTGKISSSNSLHYAGDPLVTMTFESDPTTCPSSNNGTCIVRLADTIDRPGFRSRALVGGRYLTASDDGACTAEDVAAGDFELRGLPWLVPGFTGKGIEYNPGEGMNYRYECRDRTLPFASATMSDQNVSLAMSNPVPDGRSRSRTLQMVDGAMFNQDTLIIIFEEEFESFLSDDEADNFSAYGFMLLERTPMELSASEYYGSDQSDFRPQPDVLGVECAQNVLDQIADAVEPEDPNRAETIRNGEFETMGVVNVDAVKSVIEVLLEGRTSTSDPDEYVPADEEIHYYCEDTGLFDQGPDGLTPCPVGSRVEFFSLRDGATLPAGGTWQDLSGLECQDNSLVFIYPTDLEESDDVDVEDPDATMILLEEGGTPGTCGDLLDNWRYEWQTDPDGSDARFDIAWECTSDTNYCDFDRYDIKVGKRFFAEMEEAVAFTSLEYAIREAFRYRTKFQNRSGTSLAFSPVICGGAEDTAGYCYDPDAIVGIQDRVDCTMHLYTEFYDDLACSTCGTVRGDLEAYLTQNFAYAKEPYSPVVHDGFERFYSELLIMLGDEAYTQAFASRFDLAGIQISSFNGADFEANGINLSGGAGYEMSKLYEATQYYQLALDRLYSLGPAMWGALGEGKGDFITQETVVSYFSKLIRASGQKARAWSQVAKRYQSFNRADLARAVTERAYASAYMELVVLSQLMLKVVETANEEDRDQIVAAVEEAQLRFRQSLLEMRDVYQSITDDVNFFGYAADYVPFPAVDPSDTSTNAFKYLMEWAKDMSSIAAEKEDLAIDSSREFDTDQALFMAELNSITNNYENQLEDLCGLFTGEDMELYAALPENAEMSEPTKVMLEVVGTPCGWVGNGEIYEAMMELSMVKLDYQAIVIAQNNLIAEVNIELERVEAQCDEIMSLKNITLTNADEIQSAEETMLRMEQAIDDMRRAVDLAGTASEIAANSDIWNGGAPAVLATGFMVGAVATEVATYILQDQIVRKQNDIADLEQATLAAEFETECELAQIDSMAVIKEKLLGMAALEIEAMKVQYEVQLALSNVQALRNGVKDTIDEMETAQQMLIDVAAAHNNPNVRIYKNDSIITADRTFERALKAAYAATKVYEYYTSQTYAHADDLFLVRLVQYGDYSLEAYLAELEDAYYSFEELYGYQDTRVAVLSMRDDILKIPYTGDNSQALTHANRIDMFRDRIVDASFIDEDGYRAFPFSTGLEALSPLTRNHKIEHIEAELLGSDLGDEVGRIYLRQRGTGVVHSLEDEKRYYSFPERTAVVDVFFNGEQPFHETSGEDIYESRRFKDRPFANTQWELIINQKDEQENKDIDLNSLSDIRLFIYYTDFTAI